MVCASSPGSTTACGSPSARTSTRANAPAQATRGPLFEALPALGETVEINLGQGLRCRLPLALYANDEGTLGSNPEAFGRFEHELEALDAADWSADDPTVRIANTVIAWNVFQHFYPYFDVVDIDWDAVLEETLAAALADESATDYYDTLRRMVAQLDDGHGVVFFRPDPPTGCPPIRVERIEAQIVVTAVEAGDTFEVGDVVVSIDGRDALLELERLGSLVSGSSQLREHRALNVFGEGPFGSDVEAELKRGGKTVKVKAERSVVANLFFREPEYDYPAVDELEAGVFYVNLRKLDTAVFEKHLESLAAAEAVILDYRWGGGEVSMFKVLPHLTETEVRSARWNTPQVIYPNRRDLRFHEGGWPMAPKAPYWGGRKVILTSPPVVSSGETILGIVEAFELAELVGHPTAGCNGNANFIPLPGGFRIMFTGMKVLKHDSSQHHLIGIRPGHPVERTIEAVRAGLDEVLERAREVARG